MKILHEILKLYGMIELEGNKSNPLLLEILKRHKPDVVDDSQAAWCGILMGEAFDRAGFGDMKPKNYMAARSWLNLSTKIDKPELGDIVIYWRGSPTDWRGHVGLYISETDNNIYTLGGNQSDQVKIALYDKARVLGYRKAPK